MNLRIQYLAVTAAFIFFLALTFERPAYGYTDPGSAILLFQSLSAVITRFPFLLPQTLKEIDQYGEETDEEIRVMEGATSSLATFRDPAGSLKIRPDGAYGSINPPFTGELLEFLSTPQ